MKFIGSAFMLHVWTSLFTLLPVFFLVRAIRDNWTLWATIPIGLLTLVNAINHYRTVQGTTPTPFIKGGEISISFLVQMVLAAVIFSIDYGWARIGLGLVFAFFNIGCYHIVKNQLNIMNAAVKSVMIDKS